MKKKKKKMLFTIPNMPWFFSHIVFIYYIWYLNSTNVYTRAKVLKTWVMLWPDMPKCVFKFLIKWIEHIPCIASKNIAWIPFFFFFLLLCRSVTIDSHSFASYTLLNISRKHVHDLSFLLSPIPNESTNILLFTSCVYVVKIVSS